MNNDYKFKCIHAHMNTRYKHIEPDIVHINDEYVCTRCGRKFSNEEYRSIMNMFNQPDECICGYFFNYFIYNLTLYKNALLVREINDYTDEELSDDNIC